MCGIAGYVGMNDPPLLTRMADRMAHRGPDDSGTWWNSNEGVGLAHRRLSIIDTSPAGHQPMTIDGGRLWIAFNGEIYNFLEHRRRLESDGVVFQSRTDTEVLLHLYREHGKRALALLDGMFAIAVWDAERRSLFLARDHAGVKPLYYTQAGPALIFASEIKALLASAIVRNELNAEVLAEYLTFLWVPGEATMLRGIKKLPAGHALTWQDGRVSVERWFDFEYCPVEGRTEQEWVEATRSTFRSAVRRQMVADVPLGAFLSGGLDSSSIVATMRQEFPQRPIKAYTARSTASKVVAEQGEDDFPHAQRVARELDVDLHVVDIQPDVVQLLPKMVFHLDEPDADPAVFPSYLIARLARQDGTTVLLSGTGGDEVFFGYRSHQAVAFAESLGRLRRPAGALCVGAAKALEFFGGAQHRLVRRLGKLSAGLLAPDRLSRHVAVVQWSSESDRVQLLGPGRSQAEPARALLPLDGSFRGTGALNYHSHLLVGSFLAAHNFLYTDKSSMAVSLEVRVPFMDLELMRLAASMPEDMKLRGRVTKYALKEAMSGMLPNQVIHRSKTGFGAPLRHWIRAELRPLVDDLLAPDVIQRRGLMQPKEVRRLIADNETGAADNAYEIYALLTLELWMQTFIDRRAEGPVA
jgi:asparagine synthase (glutamine-hydrolysing)